MGLACSTLSFLARPRPFADRPFGARCPDWPTDRPTEGLIDIWAFHSPLPPRGHLNAPAKVRGVIPYSDPSLHGGGLAGATLRILRMNQGPIPGKSSRSLVRSLPLQQLDMRLWLDHAVRRKSLMPPVGIPALSSLLRACRLLPLPVGRSVRSYLVGDRSSEVSWTLKNCPAAAPLRASGYIKVTRLPAVREIRSRPDEQRRKLRSNRVRMYVEMPYFN